MKRGAATRAIVGARLRGDARLIAWLCAACALFAFLHPARDGFAGLLAFASLCAGVIALEQRGTGRLRELGLCELSAPIYGRELARATALAPCAGALVALTVLYVVQLFTGFAPPLLLLAVAAVAVAAVALTALCATLRRGPPRYLYVGLAVAVVVLTYVLATVGPLYGPCAAIAFAVIAGFIALRQYGEALARYDPVAEFG